MDEKPFLEFNIEEIKENQVEELKKFHKSYFDIDSIVNTASELKYTNELKNLIQKELSNPSPEFVKMLTRNVYPGLITAKVLEQFTNLTKKSIQQHISDLITERLKTALKKEDENIQAAQNQAPSELSQAEESIKINTTEDEIESFQIIRAILRKEIDIKRIFYRDAQSYFSVILDDNNRKVICRLYLTGNKKYIGTFDENKKETRAELSSLNDIFNFSDILQQTAKNY